MSWPKLSPQAALMSWPGAAPAEAGRASRAAEQMATAIRFRIVFLLSLGGGGGGSPAPAAPHCRPLDDLVDGCSSDEAVDNSGGRVRLAEVEPEERRDEVELGDRDESPVQGADDDEHARQHVDLLHVPLLPVKVSFRDGTDLGQSCQVSVQLVYDAVHGERRAIAHRRAEPPDRRHARPPARLGEALRVARPTEDERGVQALPPHGCGADRDNAEPSGAGALGSRGSPPRQGAGRAGPGGYPDLRAPRRLPRSSRRV